jgi:hypothetical protein
VISHLINVTGDRRCVALSTLGIANRDGREKFSGYGLPTPWQRPVPLAPFNIKRPHPDYAITITSLAPVTLI